MEDDKGQRKISHSLTALLVGTHHTDIGLFHFEDKLFVVISQLEKIGTLVSINPEPTIGGTSVPLYHIRVLLGKDEPEVYAFANCLAEELRLNKPMILGVALREKCIPIESLREIAENLSREMKNRIV